MRQSAFKGILHPVTAVFVRKGKDSRLTETQSRRSCESRGREWSSAGVPGACRSWKRERRDPQGLLRASGRTSNLISILASTTMKEKISVVLSHQFYDDLF